MEALKLDGVPPGLYIVHCLPLRLLGAEGSPIRCILIKWCFSIVSFTPLNCVAYDHLECLLFNWSDLLCSTPNQSYHLRSPSLTFLPHPIFWFSNVLQETVTLGFVEDTWNGTLKQIRYNKLKNQRSVGCSLVFHHVHSHCQWVDKYLIRLCYVM